MSGAEPAVGAARIAGAAVCHYGRADVAGTAGTSASEYKRDMPMYTVFVY
jgi:hypothetical protein